MPEIDKWVLKVDKNHGMFFISEPGSAFTKFYMK